MFKIITSHQQENAKKINDMKELLETKVDFDTPEPSKQALVSALTCEYYKNKNWLQFLFIVKAAVLKHQISKFYPQIQRTEASDHIYFSQRPVINVKAIFCA